jgi:hypothetical protein
MGLAGCRAQWIPNPLSSRDARGVSAEFERDLIRDRVLAGMRRAKAQGRHFGRPRQHRFDTDEARELVASGLSLRAVARQLGTHPYLVSARCWLQGEVLNGELAVVAVVERGGGEAGAAGE